jgi:hypothetical protein
MSTGTSAHRMAFVHSSSSCSWPALPRRIVPSLLVVRHGLGLDSCGRRDRRQRTKQRDEGVQRRHGDAGVVDEDQTHTLLARGHPFGQEGPRAIGQQTPQGALPFWQPLDALDGQALTDEGVPSIVDDDGPLKLRSM